MMYECIGPIIHSVKIASQAYTKSFVQLTYSLTTPIPPCCAVIFPPHWLTHTELQMRNDGSTDTFANLNLIT